MGKKTLVAYFSCSGVTEGVAESLAKATGGDLFEIVPEKPYTAADLDWTNKSSRSTVEMNDPSSRPVIRSVVADMDGYDVVFIGFPIWWYVAPTIINTFLEAYDFSGKTIVPFCTSGGSGVGRTGEALQALCPDSVSWRPVKLLNNVSTASMRAWVEGLNL